jgi:hypothetical protein
MDYALEQPFGVPQHGNRNGQSLSESVIFDDHLMGYSNRLGMDSHMMMHQSDVSVPSLMHVSDTSPRLPTSSFGERDWMGRKSSN